MATVLEDDDNLENLDSGDESTVLMPELRPDSRWRRMPLTLQLLVALSVTVVCVGIMAAVIALSVHNVDKKPQPVLSPVYAQNGAVAADNENCSIVGVNVLKEGGNAVDAAIAAGLCQGVLSSYANTIGGGGVMLIHLQDHDEPILIDFRETAPAKAFKDMYVGKENASTIGGLAVGIPGELKGYDYAFKKYGSGNITWARLFEPAITYTRDGFHVHQMLADRLESSKEFILSDPGLKSVFAPNGEIASLNQVITWPKIAVTLQTIADQGIEAFYNSSLTQTMVEEINAFNGIFTVEDFNNFEVVERPVVTSHWQGYKIVGGGPPFSGGPCIAQALNLLELYNLPKTKKSADTLHLTIEAWKFSYSNRMVLGDPDFTPNMTYFVNEMTSKSHADILRSRITPEKTHDPPYYEDLTECCSTMEDHGTMHLSVIDKDRNGVALTSTINLEFGSKYLGVNTGILYNNEMDDFSSVNSTNAWGYPPSVNNYVAAGKKPLSSMSPTIVYKNNEPHIVIGGSGGSIIITAVMQTILNVLAYGQNIKEAIDAPRLHQQLIPTLLGAEYDFPADWIKELESLGHKVAFTKDLAVVQAVLIDDKGMLQAASDKRKYGKAAGY